jgi:hypothetical protein
MRKQPPTVGSKAPIDRVTGDVNATDTLTNLKTSKIAYSTRYSLKCRPTQRIF